ncbi:MAG: hypothetical protein JWO44_2709 [Bacteroidetes bacterium]|nr:hypothetical protein [Bacteroidota bacterium]
MEYNQNVRLQQLAVHKTGNKSLEEDIIFSESVIELEDESTVQLLLKYFLTPFALSEAFCFFHESELELNETYSFVSKIFADKETLYEQSRSLAKHLYQCSDHPKIKGGELYVALFEEMMLDGQVLKAVGIFKSESKDTFMKVEQAADNFSIYGDEGINIKKLDKGCLIYETNEENGYKVYIVDNQNKFGETQYWKNDFLKVTAVSDNYHHTKDFLNITKNYVTKQLAEDFEVNKSEQIEMLNRSMQYFKKHENFVKEEFEEEVFQDPGVIKSFQKFDNVYREDHDIELEDSFEISADAVKKQARVFKSVLKLDKNFHIYIHGNKNMIEQGVEKDGRKYYKIYFEKEL